jgi:hypothetical protein
VPYLCDAYLVIEAPRDCKLISFPSGLRHLLWNQYKPLQVLLCHSVNSRIVKFSSQLELYEICAMPLLSLLLNDGRPFELILPVSFFYGIDPIPSAFVKTKSEFLFVEGLTQTSSGYLFVGPQKNYI